MLQAISEIDCNHLTLSGGIDSSLLLYYMLKLGRKVDTFTVGIEPDHPDVMYSQMAIDHLERAFNTKIGRNLLVLKSGNDDNAAVAEFFRWVSKFTGSVIAGDGIDEFMAGYYTHQGDPTEATYYDSISKLQEEQLEPLNENSGSVEVHLPYLDKRLIYLLSQIPLCQKVDHSERKKLMVEMAQGKVPDEVIHRRKSGFCQRSRTDAAGHGPKIRATITGSMVRPSERIKSSTERRCVA